jgi:hypothetical protein
MKEMVFVPEGGLANRMRSVCSAMSLAHDIGSGLRIVWFRDWALNAAFREIFEPLQEVHEAGLWDTLTADRPRKRNMFIPAVYQRLAFDSRMYGGTVDECAAQHFDFAQWARGKRVYLTSFSSFYPFPDSDYARLFVPVQSVRDVVAQRVAQFAPYTVGVHIRRSDHDLAKRISPTSLFIEVLDAELEEHPDLGIYLATDSEEVKWELQARYGKRLMFSTAEADRDTADGIREATAELYTLAQTRKVYGSYRSSFSNMAAKLGGKALTIVKTAEATDSGITF